MRVFHIRIRRAQVALFAIAIVCVGNAYADRRMFSVERTGCLELDLPSGWEATVHSKGAKGGSHRVLAAGRALRLMSLYSVTINSPALWTN